MNRFAERRSVWIRAALIALAGCWVFSPALRGPWIWDDDLYITGNTLLRSAAGLGKIWCSPTGVNYFPITFTLQWLEWQAWGDNPVGYHCVNIGLHLLGSFLLWRLLFKLDIRHAWLGGLIFAVHPLAVESVAWISEQKNTTSLPLLLLATGAWIDYDRERSRGAYVTSVLLFLAAMLCKSTVAMFPFVLLLYAWWRRGRIGLSDLKASIPFFAVSLGLGLVTVWFERYRAMSGLEIVEAGGIFNRIAGAALAVVFYFSKSVVPFGLSLIYPPWTLGPLWLGQLLSWLLICAVSGWLWGETIHPCLVRPRMVRDQPRPRARDHPDGLLAHLVGRGPFRLCATGGNCRTRRRRTQKNGNYPLNLRFPLFALRHFGRSSFQRSSHFLRSRATATPRFFQAGRRFGNTRSSTVRVPPWPTIT